MEKVIGEVVKYVAREEQEEIIGLSSISHLESEKWWLLIPSVLSVTLYYLQCDRVQDSILLAKVFDPLQCPWQRQLSLSQAMFWEGGQPFDPES